MIAGAKAIARINQPLKKAATVIYNRCFPAHDDAPPEKHSFCRRVNSVNHLKKHGYQNQSEETRRQKTRAQEKGRRQEEVTGLLFGSPPGRDKAEWRTATRTRTRWSCRRQSSGFFI